MSKAWCESFLAYGGGRAERPVVGRIGAGAPGKPHRLPVLKCWAAQIGPVPGCGQTSLGRSLSRDNQRLQGMLTLHRVDVTRMLSGLVQQGLLESGGIGRGTRYLVPEEALPLAVPASPLCQWNSPA